MKQAAPDAPQLEEVWEWLGRLASEEGNTQQAVDWYGQGLARDAGYVPFHEGRGRARLNEANRRTWYAKGDPSEMYQEAMKDFAEALRLDAVRPQPAASRAEACCWWGTYESEHGKDPSELYRQAIEDYTEPRLLVLNLGVS